MKPSVKVTPDLLAADDDLLRAILELRRGQRALEERGRVIVESRDPLAPGAFSLLPTDHDPAAERGGNAYQDQDS